MMEIHVRPANGHDLDQLVLFNASMARETEDKELDTAVLQRGVRAVLEDPGKGRYFVAESGGVVWGALMLTLEWSDWRDGWFYWIQSVYTLPDARGRGVYRALYDAVRREASERADVCGIRLYVERENRRARSVYEKLGMSHSNYELYEVATPGPAPLANA